MERSKILSKVKSIVEDKVGLDVECIDESSKITDDLGFDSLDEVEVVMECEREFWISIPDKDWDNVNTIRDIVDIIWNIAK